MTFVAGTVLTAAALNSELASKTDLAMTQNAQTGTTYSFVLLDQTKLVTLSNASPVAVTLPLEATVAWPTGTQLRLLNQGAGTVTVAGAVGVTINGTPLTLAQYKGAVITKTGTNTWTFLPFSGGSAPAVISSTTGSPTITTNAGATVYQFNGDGTIVVGTAGAVTVLVLGAGAGGGAGITAGGGCGGGGGGGAHILQSVTLEAGTHAIKIGAGGAGGVSGVSSAGDGSVSYLGRLATQIAGGGGAADAGVGKSGLNSGGGAGSTSGGGGAAGTPISPGFSGGAGQGAGDRRGGGGGGAGGTGAAGTGTGNGGAGVSSDIVATGTFVGYGGGGGGSCISGTPGTGVDGGATGRNTNGSGAAGTANKGGGGAGAGNTGSGGAGGSGVVIVRVG